MALSYPKRNGFLYSFQSFRLLEGSELFRGLMAFTVTPKIEGKKLVFGNGRKAYGRVRGQLQVELSMTFLAESFFEFARNHPQYLDEEFNLTGVCEEGSTRDKLEIIGLSLDSSSIPFEGTDEVKVELPGMAIDILVNGVSPVVGDSLSVQGDAGAG